jgi:lipid-A-disaccharide synthase-like uncharacterized protein
MSTVLFVVLGCKVTAWKLLGYAGGFLFTSRWLVQAIASRKAGRPTITPLFWYMSIMGSTLLLIYFIFGKNDGVGIVTNLFPLILACYNLFLEMTHAKAGPPPAGPVPGETPAEVV